MQHRFLSLALCCAVAGILAACSTMSESSQKLRLGMSVAQVKNTLGGDYRIRASKYSSDGQPIEVWEFQDPETHDSYWAYFKNGRLVQWGTPEAIRSIPELRDATTNERGADKPVGQ